jgi:membrane protein YqaA with SNARE-associated domain
MTVIDVWIATLAAGFLSGFLPFVNIEVYLAGAAALAPKCPALAVVAAAALGQMAAKTLLFLGGRGLVGLPSRRGEPVRAAAARLSGRARSAHALVFASALTGVPPFYVTSVGAGLVGVRVGPFVAAGLAGRFLRFSVAFALPALLLRTLS